MKAGPFLDNMRKVRNIIIGFLWGCAICLLLSLCSCATKYVTVPEVHTQYVNHTDSFLLRDTLIQNNQTIVKELDSTAMAKFGIYLEGKEKAYMVQISNLEKQISNARQVKYDTIIQRDSIPYPVVQEKVKTKHEYTGWIAFAILAIIIGYRATRKS